MKRTMAMAALTAGMFMAVSAQAENMPKGDPAKGQQLVTQVCAACHGADGNSINPQYPKLAEQHAHYLFKQLTDFKAGHRQNPIMQGMVATLTPQDMASVADFFSEQKIKPGSAKDKALALEGEKIFKGGIAGNGVPACASCHGPTGAGIPTEFPRLGGQHADYIVTQLEAFRNGSRANDGGSMMRVIASKMSDKDIKAVAQYISGLH